MAKEVHARLRDVAFRCAMGYVSGVEACKDGFEDGKMLFKSRGCNEKVVNVGEDRIPLKIAEDTVDKAAEYCGRCFKSHW
jgi:hypothetical protein